MNTRSMSQAPRHRRVALVFWVLSAALVVGSADARKATAAQKCTATKRKLVGREIAALTACDARAVARGVAVDPSLHGEGENPLRDGVGQGREDGRRRLHHEGRRRDDRCRSSTLTPPISRRRSASTATPASALAGSFKAAGKDDACELGCQAKAAAKGAWWWTSSASPRVRRGSPRRAQRARARDDCRTIVDCRALAAIVDTFVADVTSALPAAPTTTSTHDAVTSST